MSKNNYIKFRCSDTDKQKIEARAKASDLSVSDLLRQAGQRLEISSKSDAESRKKLAIQVARAGNNLNQIARYVNTVRPTDGSEILSALALIEEQLASLS